MKLSEAILLGSIGSTQCKGYLIKDQSTCAMGASLLATGHAYIGMTNTDASKLVDKIRIEWPWATHDKARCPACKHYSHHTPYRIVEHLNDDHSWTRPQIAEWVATIEPIEQPVVTPQETTSLAEATR